MIYIKEIDSQIGKIVMSESGGALTGLWLEGQACPFNKEDKSISVDTTGTTPLLKNAGKWISRYFAGGKPKINELPLSPFGGDFRKTVWKLLCEIPYGELTTYGALAKKVALLYGREKMSAQAIGNAVGHNPISIIIPCHRVIGAGGNLTGYGGGIELKTRLLIHEGVDMSGLYIPEKGKKK